MKKKLIFLVMALGICSGVFGKEAYQPTEEELIQAEIINDVTSVQPPFLLGDYAVFTADKNARYVGIAFDFENFGTIHSFKKRSVQDIDFNEIDSFYFYILKLPKELSKLNYRLVIDGLWTIDPSNKNIEYNQDTQLYLSSLDTARYIKEVTEELPQGLVRFVYKGDKGQKIRLGGSFTNWDSWIYELPEIKPGHYQLDLPLPPGTYQYAFYAGINSIVDKGNPERCYTPDGKEASLLIVN